MKLCWTLEPTHRPTFKIISQLISRFLPSTNDTPYSDQVRPSVFVRPRWCRAGCYFIAFLLLLSSASVQEYRWVQRRRAGGQRSSNEERRWGARWVFAHLFVGVRAAGSQQGCCWVLNQLLLLLQRRRWSSQRVITKTAVSRQLMVTWGGRCKARAWLAERQQTEVWSYKFCANFVHQWAVTCL